MREFLNHNNNEFRLYADYLRASSALSRLFSDSKVPLLYYRLVENVFCKSFAAKNMAREDGAYDAIKGNTGIGIKTFVAPGEHKTEKVAEFNKLSATLRDMQGMTLVKALADYRNARIEWANRTYGVPARILSLCGKTGKASVAFFPKHTSR